MSTFVPHQLQTTKEYLRRIILTAFVLAMLCAISFFYGEYQQAEQRKQEAKLAIAKIEEAAKTTTKPPLIVEPIGGGAPMPPPPQLPKTTPKETVESIPNSRFEIDAGLVKIAMDNEASWTAIFKIVFTLLVTFFGVKLINFGFRKLEGPVAS